MAARIRPFSSCILCSSLPAGLGYSFPAAFCPSSSPSSSPSPSRRSSPPSTPPATSAPVISYYDDSNDDLKVAQIADATFASAALPSSPGSSVPEGGGGTALWLIKLRQQNGLTADGQPASSAASSSIVSGPFPAEVLPSTPVTASSSSAVSSGVPPMQATSAPAQNPLQARTCVRVAKAALRSTEFDRLNRRLLKRYGFTCGR